MGLGDEICPVQGVAVITPEFVARAITKRGDSYLRSLLIQGAKAVVLTGKYNLDPISQWAISSRQRSGWQKAVVALANKNARILWALMTHQRNYEASHISTKPANPIV